MNIWRQSRWTSWSNMFFPLVMTHSLPWKDPPFLIGKPSISFLSSVNHLFRFGPWLNHGYVSHNQRVCFWLYLYDFVLELLQKPAAIRPTLRVSKRPGDDGRRRRSWRKSGSKSLELRPGRLGIFSGSKKWETVDSWGSNMIYPLVNWHNYGKIHHAINR